jgi:cytochrome c-type biogenesis protein CcmH/NrfG
MNKVKFGLLTLITLLTNSVFAQTVEQGKKFLYYERFKSAKDAFQKTLATDPNNEEAVYYLGQSMILPDDVTPKDIADAKALYQSKLSVSNSQLLMAGIGHVELLEGKTQDARNHFEAAISLSQGKNIAVLNAIGFANGNPDSKNGDAQYAIDKLKQATLIKKFNDPDVLVNLGDAYRKNDDGGNAIQSYQAALVLNPKYARANYRIGKLYQSQGKGQESIFMEHFDNAIVSDVLYAPVYANLFNYFYESNVLKAADYFEKWLANSDEDYKSCYYRAALKYAQGYFMDAISKADECIAAEASNPYPNLFGLKANAYNRLKDSVNAIQNYAEYFKRQSSDKITSGDYIEYAKNLLKIPGNEAQAGLFVDKALALDSIESNKVQYVKSIAQAYESKKNFKDAADWYRRILNIKKNPGKVDLYNTGYNYYKGSVYDSAISIFSAYSQKFPDDIFGFFMTGKTSWIIDSTLQLGLANVAFEKTIQIGMADTVKYKSQLITCYRYFASYDANIKKDKASAVSYLDKILSLDPADAEANANKAILTAAPKAAAQKPKVAPQKP